MGEWVKGRWVGKIYLWNMGCSKWGKNCTKMVDRCGVYVRWMHQTPERRENVVIEWRMMLRNREGLEWDVKKWKKKISSMVKCMGLIKWRNDMEQKETLEWYKGTNSPQRV